MVCARLFTTLSLLLSVYLCGSCNATNNAGTNPGPMRVLLLGDSISMGYTPFVREMMAEQAVVARAMNEKGDKNENCCGTTLGVENLERWLAQDGGTWDVIHFNFGLHDLKRVHPETGKNSNDPDDPYQADPETYDNQLRNIVKRLKETGAFLVFATTTPVPSGVEPYRAPGDPLIYNTIALNVMRDYDIQVNDLFAYVSPHIAQWMKPANVHFSEAGSKAMGSEVVRVIQNAVATE